MSLKAFWRSQERVSAVSTSCLLCQRRRISADRHQLEQRLPAQHVGERGHLLPAATGTNTIKLILP